jgi:butyryl-CoA dehydrogenase
VVSVSGDPETARRQFDRMAITSPDDAAGQILTAVLKNRRRALVGPDAKVLDMLSRLPAGVYQRFLVQATRARRAAVGRDADARHALSSPPVETHQGRTS